MDIKTKFNIGDKVCHINDVLDATIQFDIVHDIIINSRGVFYNVVPEDYDLLDDTLDPIPESDLILKEKALRARTAIVKFLNEELDK